MSLDFTMGKYTDLCEAIAFSGYTSMTVRAYLETQDMPSKLIVMRHDVDVAPNNEPTMALVESDFGIRATYYFRYKVGVFQPDVIRNIAAMGHEIGYHYEALDKAKGNFERALEIFKCELDAFNEVVDIKTVSMHGNPLTRWDNRDLWREHDFRDYGVLGEAYLSFGDIVYLSDTGRTWGPRYKVKDMLTPEAEAERKGDVPPGVYSTDDVIKLIEKAQISHLYLNTHAVRWGTSAFGWAHWLAVDTAINIAKRGLALTVRRKGKIG